MLPLTVKLTKKLNDLYLNAWSQIVIFSENLTNSIDNFLGLSDSNDQYEQNINLANSQNSNYHVKVNTSHYFDAHKFASNNHQTNQISFAYNKNLLPLYSVCQDVEILGLLAIAIKNFDKSGVVTFSDHYSLTNILKLLFKFLADLEYWMDQDSNLRTVNSYGFALLHEAICCTILKIHMGFQERLEEEFGRHGSSLRGYYDSYLRVLDQL